MFDILGKIKKCRRWHLKSLEIGRCEELETLPEEIRQLKWLKKLSVTSTGITILPE
jgi:Leucine-rich repeat (LRR) protein